ncbi:hypothetical protein CJ030_MR1G025230 [Morella rubra]|uniref:Uncharacterized protein n=1 Tax=Morella rubra TaxID=262757 RepID=A0A6A1WMV4_9ROSI|nr:hypothetical protein CJ030_MR1G025230 [Morella rubra]
MTEGLRAFLSTGRITSLIGSNLKSKQKELVSLRLNSHAGSGSIDDSRRAAVEPEPTHTTLFVDGVAARNFIRGIS